SNPLRTSGSAPRIPRRSWSASTTALTERSWMPRFVATAAIPAVKHPASAASTVSVGVGPWASEANTSGWSPAITDGDLCVCSAPSPEKSWIVVRLWVPLTHSQRARHRNCAASGASANACRAPNSASTLTPLSTTGLSTVLISSSWSGVCLTGVKRTPVARRLHPTCNRRSAGDGLGRPAELQRVRQPQRGAQPQQDVVQPQPGGPHVQRGRGGVLQGGEGGRVGRELAPHHRLHPAVALLEVGQQRAAGCAGEVR